MNTIIRIAILLAVTFQASRANAGVQGAWDSLSPTSFVQGTSPNVSGWGLDTTAGNTRWPLVANIGVDGSFNSQVQMTDNRQDVANIYGSQYLQCGWHGTVSNLAVGAHAVDVWIGGSSGGWLHYTKAGVQNTGTVTVTAPPPTPIPTGRISGTSNSITAWGGSYDFIPNADVSSYYWVVTGPSLNWTGNANTSNLRWAYGSGPGTYQFYVMMSGPGGSNTTNVVTTVVQAPRLNVDFVQGVNPPASFTIQYGQNISASGWALDYQNGAPIPVTAYIDGVAQSGSITNGQSRGDVNSASASYGWSPGNNVTASGWTLNLNSSSLLVGTHSLYFAASNTFAPQNAAFTTNSATFTITVTGAPQSVSSANAFTTAGTAFTPQYSGGAGTGPWQFYVNGYTSWPATGQSGTIVAGTRADSWTPTAPGSYTFYVRKLGDSKTADSAISGPYTLTVKANQTSAVTSSNATIKIGDAFTPAYAGGNSTGAYQFSVSYYTNFPGNAGNPYPGGEGTLLPTNPMTLSKTWTPQAAGSYTFYVRRAGDSTYNDSSPGGPYTVTVLATQSAVSSADVTIALGTSFQPSCSGGSSTGGWQFRVVSNTDYPPGGNGAPAGTKSGTTVSAAWTPSAAQQYQFYVRRAGDGTYADSTEAGPYTLTVKKNQTVPVALTSATTILVGVPYTPTMSGGSSQGSYQFNIAYISNFPGSAGTPANLAGQGGTVMAGDSKVSSSWTPPAVGTYSGGIRRAGDGTYFDSDAVPIQLIVTSNTAQNPAVAVSPTAAAIRPGSPVAFTASGGYQSVSYTWSVSPAGPTISTSGTAKANASITFPSNGQYTVTVKNPANGIYMESSATSVVNVSDTATSVITFPDIAPRLAGDPAFSPAATCSNGLAVTYSIVSASGSGSTHATTNGTTISTPAAETVIVRASQAGDATHLSAPSVDKTFYVYGPDDDQDGDGILNKNERSSMLTYNYSSLPSPLLSQPIPQGWPNSRDTATTEVVGSTPAAVAVDKGGALTIAVPIWVSPGTAGMEPKLALKYSSRGGPGVAGIGWSVDGISKLTRGPRTRAVDGMARAVKFDGNDALYLDGQRLIAVKDGEYRTEIDSGTKVVADSTKVGDAPGYLTAYMSNGLVVEYGNTATSLYSRVDATKVGSATPGPLQWSVSKVTDRSGNYMTFTYAWDSDAREQRVTQIDYTGNMSFGLTPYLKVEFVYESRPTDDIHKQFSAGSMSGLVRRLTDIKCWGPTNVARKYTLSYDQQPATGWSVLHKITESDGNSSSLKPLVFDYSKHDTTALGWGDFATPDTGKQFSPPHPITSYSATGTGFIDLDGDGLPDFVSGNGLGYIDTWINSPKGLAKDDSWKVPGWFISAYGDDNGVRFVDINGDGRVDYVRGLLKDVYLNSAALVNNSHWVGGQWTLPVKISGYNGKPTGQIVDLNGDGLPDLLVLNGDDATQGAYLNTGSGWGPQDRSWIPSVGANSGSVPVMFTDNDGYDGGLRLIDLNGDGLPDLLQARMDKSNNWTAKRAWLNTGSGWVAADQYRFGDLSNPNGSPQFPIARDAYVAWGVEIIDVNGDGLADIVVNHFDGTLSKGTWLNTGNGWQKDSGYEAPQNLALGASDGGAYRRKPGAAVIDLGQDGRPWVVWNRKTAQGLIQGYAWPVGSGYGANQVGGNYILPTLLSDDSDTAVGAQFVDMDGDGAVDIVWNTGAKRNLATRPNLLTKITDCYGKASTIDYAPLTQRAADGSFTVYDKGTTTGKTNQGAINVIAPIYVVKSLTQPDAVGSTFDITYRYGGLRAHPVYGLLGFEWVRSTDGRTSINSTTVFRQDYPYVGRAESQQSKNSGNKLLAATSTTYDSRTINGDKNRLVYTSAALAVAYNPDGTFLKGSSTSTTVDDYGNPTQIVTDALSDALGTLAGFTTTTDSKYDNDEAKWLIGLVRKKTVRGDSGGSSLTTLRAYYYYDNGQLKEQIEEPKFAVDGTTLAPDGEDTLHTLYSYDECGNANSMSLKGWDMDRTGKTSTVTRTSSVNYDSKRRFPADRSNALGHVETVGYDQNLGLLTSSTRNGQTTSYEYDTFGNKKVVTLPDTSKVQMRRSWVGSVAPTNSVWLMETETSGGALSIDWFDGRDRKVRTVSLDGAGALVYTDTLYDSLGRVTSVSAPYHLDGGGAYYTNTTYDDLNRPATVQRPYDTGTSVSIATESYSYTNQQAEFTDSKAHVTRTTWNAAGWVSKEARNATAAASAVDRSEVSYGYDPLGRLNSTTADGVTTSWLLDPRGRRTSLTDPNRGGATAWIFRPNAFDEVVDQTDANGNESRFEYDKLGRQVWRNESEGVTTWTYDTASRGASTWQGMISSVAAPNGYSESYSYDSFGRASTVTRVIAGSSYQLKTSYDGNSRPDVNEYPSGIRLRNTYTFGSLSEIRRVDSSLNQQVWQATHFSPGGVPDSEIYGNGTTVGKAFSPATGQTRAILAGKGTGTEIEWLSYRYDSRGNVTSRIDTALNRTETFKFSNGADGYDGLDRLLAHSVGGGTTTISYKADGNIDTKSDVGTYTYGTGAGPQAVTGLSAGPLGTQVLHYDKNGNMKDGLGRTITWTSFNQAKTITQGSTTATFSFDGMHQRATETVGSTTTVYVGGVFERVQTGSSYEDRSYVFAPSGRVAVLTKSSGGSVSTRYFHPDALGSIVAISDDTGSVTQRYTYDAWGRQQNTVNSGTAGTSRGYTDHEMLSQLSLIHMNGRIQDPVLGRFVSADPVVASIRDPRSYNRYAYVNNNPLRNTDPTGFDPVPTTESTGWLSGWSGSWGIGSNFDDLSTGLYNPIGGPITFYSYTTPGQSNLDPNLTFGSSQYGTTSVNLAPLADDVQKYGSVSAVAPQGHLGTKLYEWGNASFSSQDQFEDYVAHRLSGVEPGVELTGISSVLPKFISELVGAYQSARNPTILGTMIGPGGIEGDAVRVSLAETADFAVRFHHPWPKYLGGHESQILEPLPEELHLLYHAGLDGWAPRWKGTQFYSDLPPELRQQRLEEFEIYTKEFDVQYGTKLLDAAVREGFSTGR